MFHTCGTCILHITNKQNIYRACDISFCSKTCRDIFIKKICLKDPNFQYPRIWESQAITRKPSLLSLKDNKDVIQNQLSYKNDTISRPKNIHKLSTQLYDNEEVCITINPVCRIEYSIEYSIGYTMLNILNINKLMILIYNCLYLIHTKFIYYTDIKNLIKKDE